MRLLTNFPFEMFGDREAFPFEYLSFGPSKGRTVGDRSFAYDIPIDPSTANIENIHTLARQISPGFQPDAMMLWWPDQEPLPEGLERCPYPVIGVMSDYNLTLPLQTRLWSLVDLLLVDTPGLQVLGRLPFARVEPWCQFSYRPDVHKVYHDPTGKVLDRDIDLCFVGNFNPEIQRERHAWTARLQGLEGCRLFLGSVPQGEPYGRLLSRSKIAFNRSIRGEVNLRCFEAAACGATLLMERENTEIRRFFEPDKEVILYGPHDLEQKVRWLLEHEREREAIAEAAQRRVRSEHQLPRQCEALLDLIPSLDISHRDRINPATRALCRAEMMVSTWAPLSSLVHAFEHALSLAQADPRVLNNYAAALIQRNLHPQVSSPPAASEFWIRLLEDAARRWKDYLPARQNLRFLMRVLGMRKEADLLGQQCLEILKGPLRFEQFDGLVLPLGFHGWQADLSLALGQTLRNQDLRNLAHWHRSWTLDQTEPVLAPHPGNPLELEEKDLMVHREISPDSWRTLLPAAAPSLDPSQPSSRPPAPLRGSSLAPWLSQP